ncbi:MAG: hypothetical protein H6Q72_1298 [Firmicutes bacterium]|nr:hypothetical protein [Bacillota bacterium]
MKLQKNHRHTQRKEVHYSSEKKPSLAGPATQQNNGEVISIFKALERCRLKLAL